MSSRSTCEFFDDIIPEKRLSDSGGSYSGEESDFEEDIDSADLIEVESDEKDGQCSKHVTCFFSTYSPMAHWI